MSTSAFRIFDQPAPHTRTAKSSSRTGVFRAAGAVLATFAALAVLVALVVVVRVGIHALTHGGQPFFHTLIERLTS